MVYWSAVRDKSMSPPVLTEESIRSASTRESDPLESIRSLVITFTVCGTSSVFMFVRVAELTVSARRDLERMVITRSGISCTLSSAAAGFVSA